MFLVFFTEQLMLHFSFQRVNLSFSFPFYGHILKEVTIATGGENLLSLYKTHELKVMSASSFAVVC